MTHPCGAWHKQISLEQDGLLEQTERALMFKHLLECESCRSYRASLRQVGTIFRTTALVEPRSNFAALVMQRIAVRPRQIAVRTLLTEQVELHPWISVPHLPHLPQVPLSAPAVLLGRVFVAVYLLAVAGVLGLIFSNSIFDFLNTVSAQWDQIIEGLNTFRIAVLALGDLLDATLTTETQLVITSSFAVTLLGSALLVQFRRQRTAQPVSA